MEELRLSATSLQDWEECKFRFLYSYVYGLQPIAEKDSLRIGTSWHGCHEIYRMVPQSKCPKCHKRGYIRPDCYLCSGTGVLPDDMMTAVLNFLNYRYQAAPNGKTVTEAVVERIKMLYGLVAYNHVFNENRFDTVTSEVYFKLPIVNPVTGHSYRDTYLVGKVDHILREKETGRLYVCERKSTTSDLSDPKYWAKRDNDLQITTYVYALRMMQLRGELRQHGISEDDPLIYGTLYDVWRKPSIEPKTLTQRDTAEFLSTGEYFGNKFNAVWVDGVDAEHCTCTVNGTQALIVPGKKASAIVETPDMYGSRLMHDMAERPTFYFAQHEISRSDAQLVEFEHSLSKLVRAVRLYMAGDLWTRNNNSCDSPFYCPFIQMCKTGGKLGPNEVPEGFKRKP